MDVYSRKDLVDFENWKSHRKAAELQWISLT